MAATAYAFLVSLLNTVDQIQLHPFLSTCFDKFQNESLRQKATFLLDYVEIHSDCENDDFLLDADHTEPENLLNRIAVVAQLAEDILEVEAADRIRDLFTGIRYRSFLQNLYGKIHEMESIKEEVIKVKEEMRFHDETSSSSSSAAPSPPPHATGKATSTTMVGFEGYLEQLLDKLTTYACGREILPIVGMGGVGKTTLARSAYENPLAADHFDVRVWVTVSQKFTVSDIFRQALSCLGISTDAPDDRLADKLHKTLYGRRYLVVLDDMWSVEAWERIMFFFPENGNRSRIILTTREKQLVDYFASSPIVVDLLDDRNTWYLFCDRAFGQQDCPTELEEIGKNIVKKCKGLPLAITVIGGLLGKSPQTQEYWEKIAEDRSLVLESLGEGNNVLSMLYLSYKFLPVCLKPCFLYLGLYPEDSQIDVYHLIMFWVAEGFIKGNRNQSMEEVAESYVKELVDRNLLLVGLLRKDKKFLTCTVHDLVRELCIKIATKEYFYCIRRERDGADQFIVDQRTSGFYVSSRTPSPLDPLILDGQRAAPFKSTLSRVMVRPIRPTCQEFNLRLLFNSTRFSTTTELPSSLSLFWSLQSIVLINCSLLSTLSPEIWNMPQLRHIDMWPLNLPDPPTGDKVIVLHNLHKLKTVRNLNVSEEVTKRIPNVKKLNLFYDREAKGVAHLKNFGSLNKLESLGYTCREGEYVHDLSQSLKLPNSLKMLILTGCCLAWSDISLICSMLPHLEVLELRKGAVVGAEWNCGEEEFTSLKYLLMGNLYDLCYWRADEGTNFPVLETLHMYNLSKLDEVPSCIGDIPTLEKIKVYDCSESATISAIKILEEQESLENHFQLQLHFSLPTQAKMWRKKIQEFGITSQNVHIYG